MADITCALCANKLQPETKGWLCDPCRAADESWADGLNFSSDKDVIDPYDSQSEGTKPTVGGLML